jgi:hypothetical protein
MLPIFSEGSAFLSLLSLKAEYRPEHPAPIMTLSKCWIGSYELDWFYKIFYRI